MRKSFICAFFVLLLASVAQAQSIVTPYDTVPNFCVSPTKSSTGNGNWSTAGTWTPSGVPGAADIVAVNHNVTYDANSTAQVKNVCVNNGGTLNFSPSINTKLTVQTLEVLTGGVLQVGTSGTPIASNVTAQIVITDAPLDTGTVDPSMYGNGIVVFGTVIMRGAVKSPTFVRTTVEPTAGQSTLTLASTPTGWANGDQIFLPDSNQYPVGPTPATQYEYATVQSISGNVVTLTAPLTLTHPGSHLVAGDTPTFLPHVANITRNIIVKSANANGTRGHIWSTIRAYVDFEYMTVDSMGRTINGIPVDNTTFSGGVPNHIGTNQQGRYPMHTHHLIGPVSPQPNGYQYTIKGISVVEQVSPTTNTHKWGINFHDSHYGLVQDNIVINAAGFGIGNEMGTETQNLIDHNFTALVSGNGRRCGDDGLSRLGESGEGFWFRGFNNAVTNNVATTQNGNNQNTFGFEECALGLGTVTIPSFQGADPLVNGTSVNSNAQAILQFDTNEAYGMDQGFSWWWLGMNNNAPNTSTPASLIHNMYAWNLTRTALYPYQMNNYTIDNFIVRGLFANATGGGVQPVDYFQRNALFKNLDMRGIGGGFGVAADILGTYTIQDSFFDCVGNGISFATPFISSSDAHAIPVPRQVTLSNVSFGTHNTYNINMAYASPGSQINNYAMLDTLTVFSYNGNSSDNFQPFYTQQASNFIMPANGEVFPGVIGCPASGLTNAQCFSQFGVALAGQITPCTATRAQINGFVCPLASVPTATPTNTPTNTPTRTPTPTVTPTGTFTPAPTSTPTFTPVPPTPTNTPINGCVPDTPTPTFLPECAGTPTATFTPTITPTATP